jgi:prevent-host-death family protein
MGVTMNHLVSISKLRQNAARVLREASESEEPHVVISRSKPLAVILSLDSYEALRLRAREVEHAEIVGDVQSGMREHRAGKSRRLRSLRDLR